MGLDIYHRQVSQSPQDGTMQLLNDDGEMGELARFAAQAIPEENTYIDWPATFATKALPADAYRMSMWGTHGDGGSSYVFRRNDDASPTLPEKVEFVESETRHELVLFQQTDQVIPYCEVGYQRKSMTGAFYDEFEGWAIITDKARVERMYELTEDFAKDNFKRQFLDNWDDAKSFVVVWY